MEETFLIREGTRRGAKNTLIPFWSAEGHGEHPLDLRRGAKREHQWAVSSGDKTHRVVSEQFQGCGFAGDTPWQGVSDD